MIIRGNVAINEPAHGKAYNVTYVTSKDFDPSILPLSMVKVLLYPSSDSTEAVEGTCNQRRVINMRECTSLSVGFVVRRLKILRIKIKKNK